MKKGLILAAMALMIACSCFAQKGKYVTFTGKVKFPDPEGKYQIYLGKYEGEGFKRAFKALDSTKLDANNSFSFKVNAEKPDFYQVRVYYFDRIDFWADKDNIHVNVRGIDTAKMKIKNPPYIYMENASANNDLINDVNLVNYLNYQQMIAVGQEQWRAGLSKDSLWINYMKNGFDNINNDMTFRIKYLINKYKDQPAVLYALGFLSWKKDGELLMSTLDNLTKKYPSLTQARDKKKEILENMASYLFSGIPYLVVVDKEGNIIEKNLRGESLDKKLKEIFGN
jgi:hypothetical protein